MKQGHWHYMTIFITNNYIVKFVRDYKNIILRKTVTARSGHSLKKRHCQDVCAVSAFTIYTRSSKRLCCVNSAM